MGGALRRRAPHEKSDVVREALQRYLEDTEDGQKWGSFNVVLSFHFRSIFIMDAITKNLIPVLCRRGERGAAVITLSKLKSSWVL
jgi:hypothetical protein